MYESPIQLMEDYVRQKMEERENAIIETIQINYGVDVNKEELVKALQYDRRQYEKGYADAKRLYEREHGKWEYEDGACRRYRCTNCHKFIATMGRDDRFEVLDRTDAFVFCPRCGADMRDRLNGLQADTIIFDEQI